MRKLWILFLVSSLVSGVMAQDLDEGRVRRMWNTGALTWDDFAGRPMTDSVLYNIDWGHLISIENKKVDGIRYHYINVESKMDGAASWFRPEMRSPQTLKYSQLIFDLVELYARKATTDLARNTKLSYREIYLFHRNQLEYRLNEVKKSTQSGADIANLDLCCASVAQELKEAEFRPDQIPFEGGLRGMDMCIGLLYSNTQSDYLKGSLWAFDWGWNFAFRNHRILTDFALGWGMKADRDFMADDYPVSKGEKISGGQISLGYGYNFSSNVERQFVGFASFGVQFFDGKQVKVEGQKGKEDREVAGPMFALGCYYDIPFSRTYMAANLDALNATISNEPRKQIFSVRIKPYIGYSHIPEFGWSPSINLSVTCNFGFYRFVSK